MTSLERVKLYNLDKGLESYLNKYHTNSPDTERVRVADYERDRSIFFTVGELREALKELNGKEDINEQ